MSDFYTQKILKKCISFHKKILSCNTDNVSRAANQHIRMISEGSCDPEDWHYIPENSALRHRNTLHLKVY